jgi:hypothetical protein
MLLALAMAWPFTATALAESTTQNLHLTVTRDAAGQVLLDWNELTNAIGYRVDYSDDLRGTNWTPAMTNAAWPLTNGHWTASQPASARFYRVVAYFGEGVERGKILSQELLTTLSTQEILALYVQYRLPKPFDPQYGVKVVRIIYETIGVHGEKTQASGALVIPVGYAGSMALGSYQHGTIIRKTDAPSYAQTGELGVGAALASIGYVMALPDYLGLGFSPGRHPYVHAKSEATAVVDMLRAVKSYCALQNVGLNGQLFLVGYSQGGQATMAAHREIELYHTNEFQITASAPMAGPQDMSGTMFKVFTSTQAYSSPWYLPYTLFSFNDAYGIYDSPSQFMIAPYSSSLYPLFDGTHSESEINPIMPSVPNLILRPEVLQAFESDESHPLRIALKDNDLFNWTPKAKMRMFHCHGDKTVPYANSQVALDSFHARGASQVELEDPYPSADHTTGSYFCLLGAKNWFETLRIK